MRVHPYLSFSGQCEAAFKFYEQCLGGTIEAMVTHEIPEVAEHVPADWRKKIMHAHLRVGEDVLMGSDAPPDRFQQPQGFFVTLQFESPEEAERIFGALAADGTVSMPLQQTFWAARFGMLVDRFGIPWMINCAPMA